MNNMLADILSSKVRATLFQMLFGFGDEELHMREISRRSGFVIGTIQTELKKLTRLDLVTQRRDGNRLYYRANRNNPIYSDIHSLVRKTVGMNAVLKKALEGQSDVQVAFVFGSLARNEAKAESDLDFMLIGELGLRVVSRLLTGVSEQIGREVNPYTLTPEEFRQRIRTNEHFIANVIKEPKMFIIGNEDDLKKLVG